MFERLFLFGVIDMGSKKSSLIMVGIILAVGIGSSIFPAQKYILGWLIVMFTVIVGVLIREIKREEERNELIEKLAQRQVAYKKIGYEISVASSQVAAVSEDLYITLEDNTAATEQLYAKAQEMSALNNQVNITLGETVMAVNQVHEVQEKVGLTTVRLNEISNDTKKTIHHSLGEIMDILKHIKDIKQTSRTTMTYMVDLNNTSKQIVAILNTVRDISRQTHLLALNAAIESARAGESGKGFSVVADEIRKLATHTAAAVKEVNELINNIQRDLSNVNAHLEASDNEIDQGVNKSMLVEEGLEKIQVSFDEVTRLVNDISLLSAREVSLASSVKNCMTIVQNNAHETADSVSDVYHSIEKQKESLGNVVNMGELLSVASQNLTQMIEQNKLNDLSDIDTSKVQAYMMKFNEIVKSFSQDESFVNLDQKAHSVMLGKLLKDNDFIEAVWTNGYKGRFVVSIPPAGIANGNVREWFKEALLGRMYMSKPYISSITKTPCITLSAPIKQKDGKIKGVIGIDIKLGVD